MVGEAFGSYRVVKEIGAGGMGRVYLAQHALIGRLAAVKVLLPEFSQNSDIIGRFFNEARTAALIRHPGLVDIFDFGYHASGNAYIVMEYLEGETLASHLRRNGRLTTTLTIAVGLQIADAMSSAHARGIVHRDLKPENIYLIPERNAPAGLRVKVLDFGIAKLSSELVGREGAMRTRTGSMLGTPLYMSPEQCRGAGKVDSRTDIYSVGCILFEMLSGRPVFLGEGAGDIMASHLREPPPSIRTKVPTVPRSFERLIGAMLEKEPARRIASFSLVETSLNEIAAETAPAAAPRMSRDVAAQSESVAPNDRIRIVPTTLTGSAAQIAVPAASRGSSRAKLMSFASAFAVIAIVGGYFVLRSSPSTTPNIPAQVPAHEVPSAPVTPPASEPRPEPAPVPVLPATVTLVLDAEPQATVYRDGVTDPLGMTPVSLKVPRASGSGSFIMRRAGYQDAKVVLPLDRDQQTSLKLKVVPAPARKDVLLPFPEKKKPRQKGELIDSY